MLIILAAITINMLFGENGILKQTQEAKQANDVASEDEQIRLAVVASNTNESASIDRDKLSTELQQLQTDGIIDSFDNPTSETLTEITVTGKTGTEYTIDLSVGTVTGSTNSSSGTESGDSSTSRIEATVENEDGTTESVTLTKANYADYLGKVVTNYKEEGGTETVTVKTANDSSETEFTVSTTYRLYYIDWDNKYGDGNGTVYLKADCTSNNYALSVSKEANDDTIRNLNPSLYATENGQPSSSNNNMKAVTWLLDTTEWSGLKTSGAKTEIGDKVKYVVGAPSLEMMMDSFNTHYKLTGDTPDYSSRTSSSARTKLFYKYTTGEPGYQVGPCANFSTGYGYYASYYSVQTDTDIDTMYYSGDNQYYWLASPSASSYTTVMSVSSNVGGFVNNGWYGEGRAFCPLVALSSDVQLKLK